jgi:GT2 family glycosyltransferase
MPRPEISILVVSWNTLRLTTACLDSLPDAVAPATAYEVIVVDNGSTDGSVEMLRARPEAVLVENDHNVGYAAAVNQAYEKSSGDLVLLLNSDIDFVPGSLDVMQRFLREHPDAAGVGPLYLNPDGSPQHHHFRLPTVEMLLGGTSAPLRRLPRVARSMRRYEMLDVAFTHPVRVEQPSASCLLLRRRVLPADYLLDEKFPIFFNDVELAHRLAQAGAELWVEPEAKVYHVHGASTKLLGGSLLVHHLGAQVRYVRATSSRGALALFRTVVLAQKVGALALRRDGAMPLGDVVRGLRGDTGPIPDRPRS